MSTDRPIFIFGCPRSGTSLVSRVLDRHPRIAIPFESHVYHYLYCWIDLFGDLHREARQRRLLEDILSMEDLRAWSPQPSVDRALAAVRRRDFHGVFEGLMRSWASDRGKPRWGEKTPQHTFFWREIRRGFPDMQVLNVVRDGRDVALSYKRAFFGPKHVYPIARRWMSFLRTAEEARAALGGESVVNVRYEDLLDDPEATVRQICAFLGEDFDPAMLTPQHEASLYPTDDRNKMNLRRPILTGNAQKWRVEMTERDRKIFESTAGDVLERYGYERTRRGAPPSRMRALQYRYLEHAPVKALAILNNRKSQKITMQRLRIYLRWRFGMV